MITPKPLFCEEEEEEESEAASKQQLFHLCPLRSGEFWQERGVMKPKEDTLLILNLLTEG